MRNLIQGRNIWLPCSPLYPFPPFSWPLFTNWYKSGKFDTRWDIWLSSSPTPPPHSPTLPTLMYMQSKMVQMRKIWYKVGISDCLGAPPPHPFPHSPDPYLQIGTNVGNLIQGGISDCLATPHFPSNFPSLPTLTNKNGTNEGNLIQGRTISFSTHHLPGFPPPPTLYKP